MIDGLHFPYPVGGLMEKAGRVSFHMDKKLCCLRERCGHWSCFLPLSARSSVSGIYAYCISSGGGLCP